MNMSTISSAYAKVAVWTDEEEKVVGDPCRSEMFNATAVCGLWDTAGQEKYRALLPMYLRGADIVIVVHEGKNRCRAAVRSLIATVEETSKAKIYMVQNKSDACEFDAEFLEEVRGHLVGWAHVSALSNHNVKESFVDAFRCYFEAVETVSNDAVLQNNDVPICVVSDSEGSKGWWKKEWC